MTKNPPIPILKDMSNAQLQAIVDLTEARTLKISKDDLRMDEQQLMWSPELESEVLNYWKSLNTHWKKKTLPKCSCADHENGFLAKEAWNPYFYDGEPCSIELYKKFKKEQLFNASPGVAREIQKIHQDPDFGGNIKNVDIKISAAGSKLTRKYSVNVLPKAETLTNEQIEECRKINLDEKVQDGQRMSFYNPKDTEESQSAEPEVPDVVIENFPDKPIDLKDIPF